jgi:transglutaminase-like putative cysteine protease
MKTRHNFIFLTFLLLIPLISFAQKPPIKLGDVTMDEMKMEKYDLDPDAEAVVLCDYGYRAFSFDQNDWQWKHDLKRICRIKILTDEGYDWATESIVLYEYGGLKEDLLQLKGYTHNLENGKIEETKLGKDNIFKEQISDRNQRVKFTMPNVKAGSIIEFQYTITSNYITIIEPWYFQQSIPVKYSEYNIRIPEYLTYFPNSSGYEKFDEYETEQLSNNITQMTRSRNSFTGQTTSVSSNKLSYSDMVTHYIAKDMPALKDEAFVGNSDNYLQSVGYQLSTYRNLNDKVENVIGNWPDIIKNLTVENENFGANMRARSFYKDITDPIMEKYATPEERIAAVYAFVSNYMKWDDRNRYVPSQNIKKTFDDRTGSSADINALLVSMLRAVEVEAEPVIMSTVSNGLVHPVYPLLDDYNYMIAKATVGSNYILLDATEKDMPLGLLPTRCLNQRGYTISSTKPGWVDLHPQKGAEKTIMCMLKVGEDGVLSGTISDKNDGYTGLNIRRKLKLDGEKKYIEDFNSSHTQWSIRDMKIEAPEMISDPVKEIIEVDLSGQGEAMGNMIYIDPIISGKVSENPFKQEERKFPIEFVIPIKYSYMINLEIPEGYVVDELPEQVNIRTSDKSAHLRYLVQLNGNRLQIVHSWGVDKTFYPADSFKELKEFYALLVSKQDEQIVLKKVEAN